MPYAPPTHQRVLHGEGHYDLGDPNMTNKEN
jgi:hypothetical protein